MRLLIVAMADSVHTVRWLNQLSDQGWDIHLFPSIDDGVIHPELRNVTIHSLFFDSLHDNKEQVRRCGIPIGSALIAYVGRKSAERLFPFHRLSQLQRLIRRLKPDVVHSMETQAAGYLTAAAKEKFTGTFPPWIHTVWGSDLYLFGKLDAHKERIRNVLEQCDYFVCEGQRDAHIARESGFRGRILLVSQATGGFEISRCSALRSQGLTSDRSLIMLKGYQNWAGRALVGLRALERCADLLSGYTVIIFSAKQDVALAAELFTVKTGVPVVVLQQITHEEILRFHGKARLSISLSISDGVPNSLLEAMVMGSFPIQSKTSCADEWIDDGKTGLLVPPEDPEVVERAIRWALADDDMVNNAATCNLQTVQERLNYHLLKQQAVELYSTAIGT